VQAIETIKLILGIGEPLVGRLSQLDALSQTWRSLKLRRDPGCPVCGDSPTVTELIDQALFVGDSAVESKLVDQVTTFEDFRTEATGGTWKAIKLNPKSATGGLDFMALQRFLGAVPPERPSEPHVGLIYAIGSIVEGEGAGAMGATENIASRSLASAIRAMARDENIASIVLRVNSPGGSANASEQIWAAVREAKAKKPIVVSMGNVAGSGGYYIACNANKIFALPDTMTGSIGVIGGKLAIGKALDNVGINTFAMSKGKQAQMWSPFNVWTDSERATVRKMMEHTYDVFVTRVSEGRGKTFDEVHAVAQGRVWTGADALKHGLVDELGSLEDALAEARELGKVGPKVGLEIYPPKPTLRDFLQGIGEVSTGMPLGWSALVADVAKTVGPLEAGVVADLLTTTLQLRSEPVMTTTLLPVVVR
ncbi:MAG: signal peptide peptidase SppA, partial [Nannocystaceae bacterium]